MSTRTADEWVRLLTDARVPAGRVNTVLEAFDLADSLGLDGIVEITDPASGAINRQVASALRLSETPPGYRWPPPRLGEHQNATWQ
jgi:crotonobetainyl-CoA:carnitine CoA-transferase CaiB-like acyl-CoA transferase